MRPIFERLRLLTYTFRTVSYPYRDVYMVSRSVSIPYELSAVEPPLNKCAQGYCSDIFWGE